MGSCQDILTQTAWAASHTKETYFEAFYHWVAAQRGKKRAIVAVAHKQIQAIYHELPENAPYQDPGADFFNRLNHRALEDRLVRWLEALGHRVDLQA